MEREEFRVGDLVTWKSEPLRYARWPETGEPAVVVEVLKETLYESANNAGTPRFRRPLTIVIGTRDEDGDFTEYHVDGRRLKVIGSVFE